MRTKTRTHAELSGIDSFADRFEYLKLGGSVGALTFGYDRWINQTFYNSNQWKQVRDYVIVRDHGCDLGIRGFEIHEGLLVHHMNPIEMSDIIEGDPAIIDPEFLVTTCHETHNAIHFGADSGLPKVVTERTPNDTTLW